MDYIDLYDITLNSIVDQIDQEIKSLGRERARHSELINTHQAKLKGMRVRVQRIKDSVKGAKRLRDKEISE